MESQVVTGVDAQKMEHFLQELGKSSTSQQYLKNVIEQTRELSEPTELQTAFGQEVHRLNSDDRMEIYKKIASRKDNTEDVHGQLREASESYRESRECNFNDFEDDAHSIFEHFSREPSDKFSISHTGNDELGHDQYSIAFSGDQGGRELHQVSSGHTTYDSVQGAFNSIKDPRFALDLALSENLPKDNSHAWADMWNSIHNVSDTPVATPLPGSPLWRETPSPITSRPPSLEPDVSPEKRGSYYNLETQNLLEVTLTQNIPHDFSEQAQKIVRKRVQGYQSLSDMNFATGGDGYTYSEYAESLNAELLERLNDLSHSAHSSPHSSPQRAAYDDGLSSSGPSDTLSSPPKSDVEMGGAESSAAPTRPLKRAASSPKSDVEMGGAESSAAPTRPLRQSKRIKAAAARGSLPAAPPRRSESPSQQGQSR
jgi:hypothetical protein